MVIGPRIARLISLEPRHFQTRGQLAAQLADGGLALVARPLGGELPVLHHDPAGEYDQDCRWHQNGDQKEDDLPLVTSDPHRAQLSAILRG